MPGSDRLCLSGPITGDIARAPAGWSLPGLLLGSSRPSNVGSWLCLYAMTGMEVAAVTSMVLTKIAATQVETVRNSSAVMSFFLSSGAHSP
jgi:hypothetical protein